MEWLSRSTREEAPIHFRFKIESFSTLSSSSFERYESCEFDAGDLKWKLAVYPNGKKDGDVKDHISLYLVLVDKKEILATFSLFLFDHIQNKYLMVQGISRLDANKSEAGFAKFISLKMFNDPSNGYLIGDTCMFGAEIFVMKNTPKGQCLSMMPTKPAPCKYTWKIEKYSGMEDKPYYSEKFTTRDHDWNISFYPKGHNTGKGNSISLFLELADPDCLLTSGRRVLVEFMFRIIDQINKKHKEIIITNDNFSASIKDWGRSKFLPLNEFNSSTAGYLVNDTCIVEAEVIVLGSAKDWD